MAAEPENRKQSDQGEELEQRHEDRIEAGDVERALHDVVASPAKLRREWCTGTESLDDANAGNRFLHERRCRRPALLQPLGPLVVAP